jgi:hypothetical protein
MENLFTPGGKEEKTISSGKRGLVSHLTDNE